MHDESMYKKGEDSRKCQKKILFSRFISLSMALFFVIGLTLAVGNLEQTRNDVGSDVFLNDLGLKHNLIAKQSMLLGKWKWVIHI